MTELPRVSIRLHGGLSTAQCVERAKLADAAGFHGVWFAENPFSRSVLPAASACAVATGRLAIGLGVLNPFNRHPTLMAMEVAALDEASNGRVIVGVGAAAPALVRAMGQKWERPLTAVRESVDIVKKLLAGETVTAHGQVFSVDGVKLEMELCRPAVPVYIGGVSNATLRICGEVGDGLNISNMCPPGYAAHALAVVRAGAQAVGRPAPADAVQYMPCAVSKDRQAARRTAKATVGALLSLYTRLYAELPGVQAGLLESSGIEPAHFRATVERLSRGEPAVDVLDDHFVETYAIAGTVDDVLARAARYGAGGVTELALTFLGEDPAASMRAVAEAMPRV